MNAEAVVPANPKRVDPYKSFRFRLKLDGRYVAGVSKVSPLKRTAEVIKHRAGGNPSALKAMPGQIEFAPITLEQGVTHDAGFYAWAVKVWDYPNSAAAVGERTLEDFRKDLVLELYNEAGQKVMSYTIFKCWASEFLGVPEMDAGGDAVAIDRLELNNEGWERDETPEEDGSFLAPAT